jgi:hypothetical protein
MQRNCWTTGNGSLAIALQENRDSRGVCGKPTPGPRQSASSGQRRLPTSGAGQCGQTLASSTGRDPSPGRAAFAVASHLTLAPPVLELAHRLIANREMARCLPATARHARKYSLVGRNSIQTRAGRQTAHRPEVRQRTIDVDGKHSHGSAGGVQGIKKFAVGADGNIKIPRACRIGADNGAR